ncbi:peptidoglycan editing factor PgeF [Immundisolibacter sp.]|uniref:peptidoglycan editing factor PgeF n=1 Tax=Immundisolibacter sp. TaxID=1934948 RepID=UPI00356409A2
MPRPESGCFRPDWPLPSGVRAASTTRHGGFSQGAYGSFNLGDHVGDVSQAVVANRSRLEHALDLPASPLWLAQRHGNCVAGVADPVGAPADARYAHVPGQVCVVLTADCLPLLLCSDDGREIAAVHCGWRGLVAGIVSRAVARFTAPPMAISAWLGPAIGPAAFEIGDEVRQAFLAVDPGSAACFTPGTGGRWFGDLCGLTRRSLAAVNVVRVHGGGQCTVTDPERFYSYRRDGVCGRMASLIWRVV